MPINTFYIMSKTFNIYGEMTYNEIHHNSGSLIIPSANSAKAETKYVPVEDIPHYEIPATYFRYIKAEGKTRQQVEEIDNDLRLAASSTAGILVDTLAFHQSLGNINVIHIPTFQLYDALNQRYGLNYSYENFRKVRCLNRVITTYGRKY